MSAMPLCGVVFSAPSASTRWSSKTAAGKLQRGNGLSIPISVHRLSMPTVFSPDSSAQERDRIFYPAVINEASAEQEEHRFKKKTIDSYFCYYSQYLPSILSKLTAKDFESPLISPLLSFNSQSTLEDSPKNCFSPFIPSFPRSPRKRSHRRFFESSVSFSIRKMVEALRVHQLEHPAEKGGSDNNREEEIEIALVRPSVHSTGAKPQPPHSGKNRSPRRSGFLAGRVFIN